MTIQQAQHSDAGTRAVWPKRALTVTAIALAAWGWWALLTKAMGVNLRLSSGTAVAPAAVVLAALVAGLAAWALLAVLERTTRRPRRNWTIVAAATLVVSLLGPAGAATAAAGAALVSLHLLVGLLLIVLLGRTAQARKQG